MKYLSFIFLLCSFTTLHAQRKIAKAEYFIDKDLGAGRGNPITISVADSIDYKSVLLSTQLLNLKSGNHLIGIRVCDQNGLWSVPVFKQFESSWRKIAKAEYFIDKDLGAGRGNPITISVADSIDYKSVLLSTQLLNLKSGNHLIGIRVCDQNGLWSVPLFKQFESSWRKIAKAEYFIDKDLGAGRGNPITISVADSIDYKSVLLSTQLLNLKSGNHLIGIRVCDQNGLWSVPVFKQFESSWRKIAKAEYFIDKDFGAGRGNPITISVADSIDYKSVLLSTQLLNLRSGNHLIGIRVCDQNGLWSVPVFAQMLVLNALKIEEENLESDIAYFPNPAIDKLFVTNSSTKTITLNVLDMNGNVKYSTQLFDIKEIDISQFSRGTYLIQQEGRNVKKIILQ